MATLISSVPKVAVVERFNCNLFSKQVSWMQQLGVKPSVQCLLNLNLNRCPVSWTATQLAQLDKCWSAEQEAAGSSPGRTNTQGL